MSLDAQHTRLTSPGRIVIDGTRSAAGRIQIEGFEAEHATGRDVAVLACLWAIGELHREVVESVERPGAGQALVLGPDMDDGADEVSAKLDAVLARLDEIGRDVAHAVRRVSVA